MWSVLSRLVAPPMVVAVSPFSIIVAIFLVLHTERARANGLVFLAGRLLALTLALAPATAAFLQAPKVIGSADLGVAVAGSAFVYYCIVASSTVAVPVLMYAAMGARADAQLIRLRQWLHRCSGVVSAAILMAVGITLPVMGISER